MAAMTSGELHLHLNRYLSLRSALGYKMRGFRTCLDGFTDYLDHHRKDGPISAQLVLDWACSAKCGLAGQGQRLSRARGFLYYLRASVPETEVPDSRLIGATPRANPYIYSSQEIVQLIEAAGCLASRTSLYGQTCATFIGLIASAGLRMGEIIRLADADVYLGAGPSVITIRESKFRKSRVVPIHPSVAEKLRAYRNLRGRSKPFFKAKHGGPLSESAVWKAFDATRRKAGITAGPIGQRPTLHALRHTFAVNRLLAWYQEGLDVNRWLPHLSVYMGHVEPKCTYWYITATPQLFRFAADAFERFAGEAGAS
jgi:integrase/recombinase XerD